MNAQEIWKLAYRQYMFAASYRVRVEGFNRMKRVRREAALERIIARLQRENAKLTQDCHDWELNARYAHLDVAALWKRIDNMKAEFDRSISQALNKGDGVYRP